MEKNFKDHFSDKSDAYSVHRPGYPDELFSFLATLTEGHDRAWDCGTGSGQSAVALTRFYAEVIATDASENQIKNAKPAKGVIYKNQPAEQTTIESESVDLITVAQALHWFDFEEFGREANRVLKPGGILAAWTYGLHKISPEIDEVIDDLYGPMLNQFWPPERQHIDEGYENIKLPMREIKAPEFRMEIEWDLSQLIGYLKTWSAVKKYESQNGANPVDLKYEELQRLWGNPDREQLIKWPLTLKVWTKSK
ncbi:MAG: class I SAM-dependent methyltransferase [Gammaproteobacteria bacterium]